MARVWDRKMGVARPRSHLFASNFLPFDPVRRLNYGQEIRQKDGGKNISTANSRGIGSARLNRRDVKSIARPAATERGRIMAGQNLNGVSMRLPVSDSDWARGLLSPMRC